MHPIARCIKVADRSNVIIEVVLLKPMLYTLCGKLTVKPSETQVILSMGTYTRY